MEIAKAWSLSINTWYHIVLVRTSNTWKFFVDGTQLGSDASASGTMPVTAADMYIGYGTEVGGQNFNGWLDEVRISKGIARWTTNFTSPTLAYGSTFDTTPTINSANTFESKTWDISAIPNANKEAIDQIQLQIVNADAANTFYIDNMYATSSTAFTQACSETSTVTDIRILGASKPFGDTVTGSDAQSLAASKLQSESVNMSDAILKSATRSFTETVSVLDTIFKYTSIIRSDTSDITDIVNKLEEKLLSDIITILDTRINDYSKYLPEQVSITDQRKDVAISKVIANTITVLDDIYKSSSIIRADTVITIIDLVNKATTYHTLVDSISVSDVVFQWLKTSPHTFPWSLVSDPTNIWTAATTSTNIWTIVGT
jgi:hypothetical protein